MYVLPCHIPSSLLPSRFIPEIALGILSLIWMCLRVADVVVECWYRELELVISAVNILEIILVEIFITKPTPLLVSNAA